MARLIDADTLKGYLMQSTVYAWDAEQDAIAHRWVLHAIDNAPTIDAVPQWIPCEERLPKCNETIIFTEVCRTDVRKPYVGIGVYYGIDEWNYFKRESEKKKLDELGYMSDRIRIGGRKWHVEDSNVVAWMPLPEPYEGERKDDE